MVMIMQGGEILKLIGYTRIQDTHDGPEERHPTYIIVTAHTQTDKILIAQNGDAFEQVGVIGFRDPDDRYNIQSHKTYIQVSKERLAEIKAEGETLPYGVGALFADAMKRYIEGGLKL